MARQQVEIKPTVPHYTVTGCCVSSVLQPPLPSDSTQRGENCSAHGLLGGWHPFAAFDNSLTPLSSNSSCPSIGAQTPVFTPHSPTEQPPPSLPDLRLRVLVPSCLDPVCQHTPHSATNGPPFLGTQTHTKPYLTAPHNSAAPPAYLTGVCALSSTPACPRAGLRLLPLAAAAVDGGGDRMNNLQHDRSACPEPPEGSACAPAVRLFVRQLVLGSKGTSLPLDQAYLLR